MKNSFFLLLMFFSVSIFAQNPEISVYPSELEEYLFPDEILVVPLTISNTGTANLNFGIVIDPGVSSWLYAEPLTGIIPAGSNEVVNVTLDATDFFNVIVNGEIIIVNNAGDDVIVPVMMQVDNQYPFPPPENVQIDEYAARLTWTPPAAIICQDFFDYYDIGAYLAESNPDLWSTWNNLPGSDEDVIVTDTQSASPANSILIEAGNNIVMNMQEYTSGFYMIDFIIYVPTGNCGYFNLQKSNLPGTELAMQAYFMADGTAIVDAMAQAAATFSYPQDEWINCWVMIDLDNDWAELFVDFEMEIAWQWSLGIYGVPGLLQLGGLNFQGISNPNTNDIPAYYIDNVKFINFITATDDLTGYNVYLDGNFIDFTTDLEYFYDVTLLTPNEEQIAGVSAVYDDPGESSVIELPFTYPGTCFMPPYNLQGEVQNFNEVYLTWDYAISNIPLSYCQNFGNEGFGFDQEIDYICLARFTADELEQYYDLYLITDIRLMLYSMDFNYIAVQVYEGGSMGDPGNLIYNQEITNSAVTGQWVYHLLSDPVPIVSDLEYWVGYEIHATGDHPAAIDNWPAYPEKGDWINCGGNWQELSTTYGVDHNWMIEMILNPQNLELENSMNSAFRESRSLAGYNIYRDGYQIGTVEYPFIMHYYDSDGLNAGNYNYYVTAYFEWPSGESCASNIENVEIILPAPQDVTGTYTPPDVIINWASPENRTIENYNIYKNGSLIGTTTSSTFIDCNVQTGAMLTYNISANYTGGFEGDLSEDCIVYTGLGTEIEMIPIVTQLGNNFPNPFNPETEINFSVTQKSSFVNIEVFNLKGQKVKTLLNEVLPAGNHSVIWNGKDDGNKNCSSGVYLYKMKCGDYSKTKKMILLR